MLIRMLLLVETSGLRNRLCSSLAELGVLVFDESEANKLWSRLGEDSFDLVVATRSMLPTDVERGIEEIRSLPYRPEVIVLADLAEAEERAALQKGGAFAVIDKTMPLEPLIQALRTVLLRFQELGVSRLRESRQQRSKLDDFSSESPVMRRLLELARRVSNTDTSLLILGETGVGKEWLARAVHSEGTRSALPFIAVNCAAVPETLLESELFGHERGAFTGAVRARRGCFELAHRGTLFLDEVGDIPVHLQAKLLRALQEREIHRLGAESPIRVDARVMAATNRNLEVAIEAGQFRPDLFYRLSVVTLTIPPLRERREDIVPLVENYLEDFRQQMGRLRVQGIEESALEAMCSYEWPGNVRELINVVERAMLLCDGEVITHEHLPDAIAVGFPQHLQMEALDEPFSSFESLLNGTLAEGRSRLVESFECEYLSRLLQRTSGNIAETAVTAGIDPRTLYNKMKAFGLRKEDFRQSTREPLRP
ncbi:MAG: sigma-54 dependent transcriptional regulator [Thermoanaerobaculia bacterium]|jgi:DNA-binding NtrC family response regulator